MRRKRCVKLKTALLARGGASCVDGPGGGRAARCVWIGSELKFTAGFALKRRGAGVPGSGGRGSRFGLWSPGGPPVKEGAGSIRFLACPASETAAEKQ